MAPRRRWSRSWCRPTALVAGGQALFTNTTEIRLGSRARLGMASLQELGPDQVVFQQRIADLGDDADLRWALAQLGGRLVRSRVDNVLRATAAGWSRSRSCSVRKPSCTT